MCVSCVPGCDILVCVYRACVWIRDLFECPVDVRNNAEEGRDCVRKAGAAACALCVGEARLME